MNEGLTVFEAWLRQYSRVSLGFSGGALVGGVLGHHFLCMGKERENEEIRRVAGWRSQLAEWLDSTHPAKFAAGHAVRDLHIDGSRRTPLTRRCDVSAIPKRRSKLRALPNRGSAGNLSAWKP